MKEITQFLERYGLSEKEMNVYLACLQLGEASVLTLSKRALIKRPTTYLILDELMRKGLVDSYKTKKGLVYRALHPKKIGTQLKNLEKDFESILPEMMGMYHNAEDKPIISVYEDYSVYTRLAEEVRAFVETGKEALYFGNSEDFYEDKTTARKWFQTMKHKRAKCREIICGSGKTQKEYIAEVQKLENPNYQAKLFANNTYTVVTEFGVWGDKVVFYSGAGKDLYMIVVESKKLADMQRAIFEQIWQTL